MIDLSVIVPTYNEEPNIRSTTEGIVGYLRRQACAWEVLLVDDGSTDATLAIEQELAAAGPHVRAIACSPNRGKGHVVREGMLAASGMVRLFLDADYSTPIEEIEKLLPALDAGADIAIGTRRCPDAQIETKPPFHRYVLGELYIRMASWLLGSRVGDYNCGFKAFRGDVAERLFGLQRRNDWSFDAEVLALAQRLGYRIAEVPVRWAHAQATSKVHPIRDGLRSFHALLQIRRDLRSGVYGPLDPDARHDEESDDPGPPADK